VSEQDGGEEASWDDPLWDDFEARFPPEAFAGVARALGWLPDPAALASLRCSLIEPFLFFYESYRGEPSRVEQIKGLSKLRSAARTLLRLDRVEGSTWTALTRQTYRASWNEQFRATLRRVADEADQGVRRYRSSRGKSGRPRKEAFWQLTANLIRVFERETSREAERPNWAGGNNYTGKFYEFVAAVERCLRTGFSQGQDPEREVLDQLPDSPGAVGDGLRKHWAEIRRMAGEK